MWIGRISIALMTDLIWFRYYAQLKRHIDNVERINWRCYVSSISMYSHIYFFFGLDYVTQWHSINQLDIRCHRPNAFTLHRNSVSIAIYPKRAKRSKNEFSEAMHFRCFLPHLNRNVVASTNERLPNCRAPFSHIFTLFRVNAIEINVLFNLICCVCPDGTCWKWLFPNETGYLFCWYEWQKKRIKSKENPLNVNLIWKNERADFFFASNTTKPKVKIVHLFTLHLQHHFSSWNERKTGLNNSQEKNGHNHHERTSLENAKFQQQWTTKEKTTMIKHTLMEILSHTHTQNEQWKTNEIHASKWERAQKKAWFEFLPCLRCASFFHARCWRQWKWLAPLQSHTMDMACKILFIMLHVAFDSLSVHSLNVRAQSTFNLDWL